VTPPATGSRSSPTLEIADGRLRLHHRKIEPRPLRPAQRDTFEAAGLTLSFERDRNGTGRCLLHGRQPYTLRADIPIAALHGWRRPLSLPVGPRIMRSPEVSRPQIGRDASAPRPPFDPSRNPCANQALQERYGLSTTV
jgi:hypothetical protein